jgi:hypothetical protein
MDTSCSLDGVLTGALLLSPVIFSAELCECGSLFIGKINIDCEFHRSKGQSSEADYVKGM